MRERGDNYLVIWRTPDVSRKRFSVRLNICSHDEVILARDSGIIPTGQSLRVGSQVTNKSLEVVFW